MMAVPMPIKIMPPKITKNIIIMASRMKFLRLFEPIDIGMIFLGIGLSCFGYPYIALVFDYCQRWPSGLKSTHLSAGLIYLSGWRLMLAAPAVLDRPHIAARSQVNA